MSAGLASAIFVALTLTGVCGIASTSDAATRTLPADIDAVWRAARSTLTDDGWKIESEDRRTGAIFTIPRDIAVQQAGMYAEGMRQYVKVTLRTGAPGTTTVTVDRELFWEERFLWDSRRWSRPADRRDVEDGILDRIARRVPDTRVATVPPARAVPPSELPSPSAPARPPQTPPRESAAAAARAPWVTYRITGNGTPVQVTYRDVAGSSVSHVAASLPWELSFAGRGTAPLYVSGVGQGPGNVSLSCEILVDGHPQSQSMSVGASALASCSAPVP